MEGSPILAKAPDLGLLETIAPDLEKKTKSDLK
jgi:hypothetical protein